MAGTPDQCRACQFRLRLRRGLTRAPLDAECPRCQSLVLFTEGLSPEPPSPFAERMAGLSDEERLRFYMELTCHLGGVFGPVVDRAVALTEKVELIRALAPVLQFAALRSRRVGCTDRDFGNVVAAVGPGLDRHSRRALVRAAADSYRAATGREMG